MKLYIRPAACSLSPHIVARELGLDVDIVEVERGTNRTADGQDFLALNPNGYVPVLMLEDGEVLIEGPTIVQYLADMRPSGGLAPTDARERRRVQSLLNFVSSELHKPMLLMFYPDYAAVKGALRSHLTARLDWISAQFAGDFLTGDRPSVADVYLFVCLNWSPWVKFDLSPWPRLEAFMRQLGARPAVREALEAEGLAHRADGMFFAPRGAA